MLFSDQLPENTFIIGHVNLNFHQWNKLWYIYINAFSLTTVVHECDYFKAFLLDGTLN